MTNATPSAMNVLSRLAAGAVRGTAARAISGLSEKDLKDIGLPSRSLAGAIDREIGKPRLVDFAWRLGR